MLHIRPFQEADRAAVIALWTLCKLTHPTNDPCKDISRKLRVDPARLLVGECDGCIVATAMVGYEGHRGWINYLAVHPDHQRRGFGRQMLDHAERLLRAEGCPKINLQVRLDNVEAMRFYENIGYERYEAVSYGKRLEHDGPRCAGGC